MTTPAYLVTHSGGFHADELLSSVILTRLFPQAELVRSRDKAWITPAEDRIIYDVGGDYDLEKRIFDHHQRPAPLREDGQPYSSFGLIWQHYGADYLRSFDIPEQDIAGIHTSIDRGFVLPVDLVDNGALSPSTAGPHFSELTLPVLLEGLKPVFDDLTPDADTALSMWRLASRAPSSRPPLLAVRPSAAPKAWSKRRSPKPVTAAFSNCRWGCRSALPWSKPEQTICGSWPPRARMNGP